MPASPTPDARWQAELLPIYRLYSGLAAGLDRESGLGGKLLFAGALDVQGCRLIRASNIAGAASMSVIADPVIQREAMREGVIDILVTSLDEALRVVKNEIRKHQGVAVGIAVAAEAVLAEMRERGVLPDLLPPAGMPGSGGDLSDFTRHGARHVEAQDLAAGCVFLAWSTPPPHFEAQALALLPPDDYANRRWLRLSHRYLGPAARRVRSLACTSEQAASLRQALDPPVL